MGDFVYTLFRERQFAMVNCETLLSSGFTILNSVSGEFRIYNII